MGNVHLHPDLWREHDSLSLEDREELVKPFTMEEVEKGVKSMKINTAPGPDGFTVSFFR